MARIEPVGDRHPISVLDRPANEDRVRSAARPGFRPRMRHGDGSDRLGDALAALRDEELLTARAGMAASDAEAAPGPAHRIEKRSP